MTPFAIARNVQEILIAEHKRFVDILIAVSGNERGPMGLTPDHIKATPEWQTAYRNERNAFQVLRNYNKKFCKEFAKEIKLARRK